MIVTAIFKAIMFYFLFITIRGAIRAYSNYSKIKEGLAGARQQAGGHAHHSQHSHNDKSQGPGEVVEAEYRVID